MTSGDTQGPTPADHAVDVLVIGSGCGGMTAALTAHQEGLDVLVVEKTDRIGGSTAVSGGALWLPLNDVSNAMHADSIERVWDYLHATVGTAASEDMRRAFLDAAPDALRYMLQHSALRVAARAVSPDYYPGLPGAAQGSRAVDTLEFDGRLLGRQHFAQLRAPLAEFMVLGGMMVTITDARHLLAVTRSFASWRHGMRMVLRYFTDRLRGYPRGTRLLLGNALAARLFKSLLDRRIPYWLDTPALELLRAPEGGRVMGARLRRNRQEITVHARRGVVVATGGFSGSAELRARHYRQPAWPHSMAPHDNAGDGLGLAQGVGAVLGSGHTDAALWAPVSVRKRGDGSTQLYPHLVWDRAKPGLLAVNAQGRRFVNEACSYHDFVRALYGAPGGMSNTPALLVCGAEFMERWGLGLALPGGRPREHLVREGYLLRAPTLAGLASQAGIDAAAFVDTVARYDRHAATGQDPDFHKGVSAYDRNLGDATHQPNPCVGPLGQGPYYAVKVYPGDVGTVLGIQVDTQARALDAQGRVIDGLYVVGNDMHSIAGGEYPGPGIALGPALTFGWLAGMHLAKKASA